MKLNKFLLDIKEEWIDSVKSVYRNVENNLYDIFKNPTKREIAEIGKKNKYGMIRFIALPNKTLYIFNGELLHHEVLKKLDINRYEGKSFTGTAMIDKGGTAEYLNNDFLDAFLDDTGYNSVLTPLHKNLIKNDWSWVDKYFPNFSVAWGLEKRKVINKLNKRKNIREEWIDTIVTDRRALGNDPTIKTDIFKNPTKKEMDEFGNTLRYIAYAPTKKLFVFSSKTLHPEIALKLNLGTKDWWLNDDILGGVAVFEYGKWITDDIHNITYGIKYFNATTVNKILEKDWSWVDKYINVSNYLVEIKKKKNKLLSKRKNIKEEWSDTIERQYGTKVQFDVFINPSRKEIMEIVDERYKTFRFYANSNKKFYVFSSELLHLDVIEKFGENWKSRKGLTGTAKVYGKTIQFLQSDEINAFLQNGPRYTKAEYFKNLIENDWSWIDKYLNNFSSDWNEIKKKIEDKLKYIKEEK